MKPFQDYLDSIEVKDPRVAHRICALIPAQCPFARTIPLPGGLALRIPPLCKLNPFYEQLVALRFRALCYLDECGEDIGRYTAA